MVGSTQLVDMMNFFEFLRLWLGECLIKSFAKEPLVQSSVMGTNIQIVPELSVYARRAGAVFLCGFYLDPSPIHLDSDWLSLSTCIAIINRLNEQLSTNQFAVRMLPLFYTLVNQTVCGEREVDIASSRGLRYYSFYTITSWIYQKLREKHGITLEAISIANIDSQLLTYDIVCNSQLFTDYWRSVIILHSLEYGIIKTMLLS